MKNCYPYFVLLVIIRLFIANNCNAQTIELKQAPAGVNIDGDTKEWGDKLNYTDDKAKVSYTIGKDKDNLYLVLKTRDTVRQSCILGAGLTFTVKTNDKKSITFPVNELDNAAAFMDLDTAQTQIKTILTQYKKIKVDGFERIEDELLSVTNPYGIQIAIGYRDGYLMYEEAIPLTLLHTAGGDSKNQSFSVKINGLEKQEIAYFFVGAGGYGSLARVGNELIDMAIQGEMKRVTFSQEATRKWVNAIMKASIESPERKKVRGTTLIHPVEFGGEFVLGKTP